ncbi:MAG: GNAT family protein [Propionibacteriales bacterium]|nr:GNAT family protein [Propionibacteriales bacterium]
MRHNEYDQPVGDPVVWSPRPAVVPVTLVGRYCRLEPWTTRHLAGLYATTVQGSPTSSWTYLNTPSLASPAGLGSWLDGLAADPMVVPLVICEPDGNPVGTASYMRLDAANGSVEVGSIAYAAALQRTTAATEAMYLMMRHVFDDLGYRRYEWKCDSLNAPSRRAAERLGFTYEGTFRNALVYYGRNRDTAWFSITDTEWPAIRSALEAWLAPENFDAGGNQKASLGTAR